MCVYEDVGGYILAGCVVRHPGGFICRQACTWVCFWVIRLQHSFIF